MPSNPYDEIIGDDQTQTTTNPYDGLIDDPAQDKINYNTAVISGVTQDPDRAGEVQRLSEELNIPAVIVYRNYDELKKTKASEKLKYESVADENPGLAKWMQTPENVAISHDDIDSLKNIDSKAQMIRASKPNQLKQYPGELQTAWKTGWAGLGASAYHLSAAFGKGNIDDNAKAIADYNRRQNELRSKLPDYATEFNAMMKKEGGDVEKAWGVFTGSFDELRKKQIANGLMDFSSGALGTVGELIDVIAASAVRPRGLGYALVENAANMAPALGLGVTAGTAGAIAGASYGGAAGAVTGPGAAVTAGTGAAAGWVYGMTTGTFAGQIPVEIGSWMNESLQNRGVDITNPDAIKRAYQDQKLIAELRGQAIRKGVTIAAVDAIVNLMTGGAGKTLKATGAIEKVAEKTLAKKALGGVGKVAEQMAGEAVGEYTSQIAAYKDISKASITDAINEGIVSMGHGVVEVAGGHVSEELGSFREKLSKDPVVAAEELATSTQTAMKTLSDIKGIEDLGEAVRNSKVLQRNPKSLANLIESSSPDGSSSQVHFQVDDFDSYFNRKGSSPIKAAEQIMGDNGQAYVDAKNNGTPLSIPLKDYIVNAAPSEMFSDLTKLSRIDIDGVSFEQAVEHMKILPQLASQLANEIKNGQKDFSPEQQIKTVKENITNQLVQNLGYTSTTAKMYAELFEPFRVMAEKVGMSPTKLFSKYGIKIEKGGTGPIVDELSKGTLAQSNAWKSEGYTISSSENPVFDDQGEKIEGPKIGKPGSSFTVTSKDANGNEAGSAKFYVDQNGDLMPDDRSGDDAVTVKDEHRRKGLASAMYAEAEALTGKNVIPSASQTKLGKLLAEDRVKSRLSLYQDGLPMTRENVNPLGFYSKLRSAVNELRFEKMPAKDLKNKIKNLGVKSEEMYWTGIDNFLDMQSGQITKEQVMSYLDANGLNLSQKVMGGSPSIGGGIWSAVEYLSADDVDPYQSIRNDYADEKVEYFFEQFDNDEKYEVTKYNELRDTIKDSHLSNEPGPGVEPKYDEESIRKEIGDLIHIEEYAVATDRITNGDDYYESIIRISHSDHDVTIEGNDERGYHIYGRDISETVEGNLEEAKIKAIGAMIDNGLINVDRLEAIDINDLTFKPLIAKKPRRFDSIVEEEYQKNKARYDATALEERPPARTDDDIDWNDDDRNWYALDLAKEFIESSINDPDNKDTFFALVTSIPTFSFKITGSGKKGFHVTFKHNESLNHHLLSPNINAAKADVITFLKNKHLLVDGRSIEDRSTAPSINPVDVPTGPPSWGKHTLSGGTNYREFLLRVPDLNGTFEISSHWGDIDKVLGHLRVSDRITQDGKKVFYIEELQSDWHQEGRKYGYKSSEWSKKVKALENAKINADAYLVEATKNSSEHKDKLEKQYELASPEDLAKLFNFGERFLVKQTDPEIINGYKNYFDCVGPYSNFSVRMTENGFSVFGSGNKLSDSTFSANDPFVESVKQVIFRDIINNEWRRSFDMFATDEQMAEGDRLNIERNLAQFQADQIRNGIDFYSSHVDDAPFKDTKAWTGLLMKRALHAAIVGGYDKVMMSEGQVQADRWAITNWVDTIEYKLLDSGLYKVGFYKNGDLLRKLSRNEMSSEDLIELVGKDIFVQISNNEGLELPGNGRRLEQKSLHVGGAGHKILYDVVIPSATKDVLKQIDKTATFSLVNHVRDFGGPLTQETREHGNVMYANSWNVDITDKMRSDINKGFTLFQDTQDKNNKEALAAITFNDAETIINLFKNHDPSSLIHEMGHMYLKMYDDMVKNPGATVDFKNDYATIRDWLGAKEGEELTKEQHEMFADGFMTYVMEGTAPSTKLRKAFASFRTWLVSVYRNLSQMRIQITPEIRDVFNRMMATDDEIKDALRNSGISETIPSANAFGMTGETAKKYNDAVFEVEEAAKSQLQTEIMEGFKKKRTNEWKQKRKEITQTVEKEVNENGVYRALSILQKGKLPDGSPLPAGMDKIKISKKDLVEMYGEEFVKTKLPKPYIYSSDGGLHPNIAANILGFESGDALIQTLSNAQNKSDFIELQVNMRLADQFHDLLTDDELSDHAMSAVHNSKRSKILHIQMEYLLNEKIPLLKESIRKVVRRMPSDNLVKSHAASTIAKLQINNIRPSVYLRAEKKFAAEAGKSLAKGDFATVFDMKEKELLNFELYRAAIDAKENIKNSKIKFRKFNDSDEKLSKTRDINFVNAGRAILAKFGLSSSDKTAAQHLAPMKQYDPEAYETMIALIESIPVGVSDIDSLTFDQFTNVKDTLNAIWEVAKTSRQIEIDGKKVNLDDALGVLNSDLSEKAKPGVRPGFSRSVSDKEKSKMRILGAIARIRRVEQWVHLMDKGKINGIYRKYLWNPVNDAVNKYKVEQNNLMIKFGEILAPIEKGLSKGEVYAPELHSIDSPNGYIFKNKAELLGALLHRGNISNMSKLLRGRGWGEFNDDGVTLNTSRWDAFELRMQKEGKLTKADYDAIQGIWDLMEEIKPDAQKAHKKMYGFYFNEVTSDSFTTEFGTYRGGYAPAKVDPLMVEDAALRQDKEILEKFNNTYAFPTTGRGATKSRIEQYAKPLLLDLRLVPQHLDWALRFSYIEPAVKDVAKIVTNADFRSALAGVNSEIGKHMLMPYLQRAATQRVETPGSTPWFDHLAKTIRRNAALQIMVGNVTNTLQQFTGLSIAALRVKPRHLRNALWDFIRSPSKMSEAMADLSDMMKVRTEAQTYDVQQRIDDIVLDPNKLETVKQFAQKHGYFLQTMTQGIVDTITWTGAFNQAIEENMNEADAIRAADSAVKSTQGSGSAHDISAFETGTPFVRAFTMFQGYFNMQANLLGTEFALAMQEAGIKKGAGRALYIYFFGFMAPAMLNEMIVRAMSGRIDDDDDEKYMDEFMQMFFEGQIRNATALVPVVGPVVQSGINASNSKPYDDRISLSPAVSMIESTVRVVPDVYNSISKKNVKKGTVRDVLTAVGICSGLPVTPLSRPIGYAMDIKSGKARPTGPIDLARGLITGKSGAVQK